MECFWERLAREKKPVWLYGTGNGADKILDCAERFGIWIRGVFASDGFVRNRVFRGFPVKSYAEALAADGEDIAVLLAFGTNRPEVMDFIRTLDARHDLILPEVPLYGGDLFDGTYAARHAADLEKARALFCDGRSGKLFDDAVRFRLTGKLDCLADTEPFSVTCASLLGRKTVRTAVDGGAYRGDTTEVIAETLRPEKIYAAEPDPKSFEKLCSYAGSETRTEIVPVRAVLGDKDGETVFSASGSRGAGTDGKNRRSSETAVRTVRLDTLLQNEPADFIKLDIEGAEERALRGGERVILRDGPSLAVSLYHRTDDLWKIPLAVHGLLPDHRLYLRRVPCFPMWDLTLWAVL